MENNHISGAEGLLKSLICEGVDTIFGYPGGQIISVYDKLYDYTDKLHHILVRHEQGAIHAAQGYARTTGRPGVVIVTSGPGATNVVTGLADALMDSTPIVVISGQVASDFLGTDAFQEADVVAMTQQVTKWAIQIRRPEDIPAAVARAFYIASTGRPGPVVLDIAKDAQVGMMDWSHEHCRAIRSYNPCPDIEPEDIDEVAQMLESAKKPLIIAGHGVMIANAEKSMLEVAEKGNIPVATTLLGLSTISSDHPLNKGMVGMHGNLGPNSATLEADVIVGVGLRFDDRVVGDFNAYAPNARIVHVDIESAELNRNIKTFKTIHADANDFFKALAQKVKPAKHTEWLSKFDTRDKIEIEKVIEPVLKPAAGPLHMGEVIRAVADAAPDNAICVTDVGQNQMFAARYFRYHADKSFLSSGGLGTMGFGLPAAMGAKIGAPDRTVCLFVGDGGLQMTIQELGTIMAYNIGVKIILLNNDYLGNVRQWQELFFNSRFSQTPLVNPDFNKIAEAYGIRTSKVTRREDLADAIADMLADDNAYLLNAAIGYDEMIFPMIAAGTSFEKIMLSKDENYFPLK